MTLKSPAAAIPIVDSSFTATKMILRSRRIGRFLQDKAIYLKSNQSKMQFLRNLLSVIAGMVLGSAVNMGLVLVSGYIIPLPEGAVVNTVEGLKASIHLFEPKHFLFPFLAHAVGTLAGSFTAVKLSGTNSIRPSIIVALLFLAGGIQMVMEIPAPMWFNVVDLVLAYLPMAWIGHRLAAQRTA